MWGPVSESAPKFPIHNGSNPHGSVMAFKIQPDGDSYKPSLQPAWISADFNLPDPVVIANGVVFALSTGENAQQTGSTDEKRMPTEPGAINGGLMKRTSDTPTPVITIEVDSIDDSLKKVDAGGGSTIQPRTPIPDMGAFAYFKDSEGNVMGLWENG